AHEAQPPVDVQRRRDGRREVGLDVRVTRRRLERRVRSPVAARHAALEDDGPEDTWPRGVEADEPVLVEAAGKQVAERGALALIDAERYVRRAEEFARVVADARQHGDGVAL